jgi:hypothetical protein
MNSDLTRRDFLGKEYSVVLQAGPAMGRRLDPNEIGSIAKVRLLWSKVAQKGKGSSLRTHFPPGQLPGRAGNNW